MGTLFALAIYFAFRAVLDLVRAVLISAECRLLARPAFVA